MSFDIIGLDTFGVPATARQPIAIGFLAFWLLGAGSSALVFPALAGDINPAMPAGTRATNFWSNMAKGWSLAASYAGVSARLRWATGQRTEWLGLNQRL